MYLKNNGLEIKTLVLSGGGTSVFSMYLGLLKDIDINTLTFDLVLCSAGALWFCEVLCRKLQSDIESHERIERLNEIHRKILEVDLVTSLELEHESILNEYDIEYLRLGYSCLKDVRIKDLKEICNGHLVRFSVSNIKENALEYEPIIVDETNSPDALVFDVVLASCSLPLIFPTVSLTINGEVRQCLDGGIADYPSLLSDDKYTIVQLKSSGLENLFNHFKTKIPLIDNLLKLVASVVLRGLRKTLRGHVVFHDCIASMETPMWNEELYKMGQQIFEDNFTFQRPLNH